jgi:chromosomal replication initiation ATPase DnaA
VEAWRLIVAAVRAAGQVSQHAIATWLESSFAVGLDAGVVTLAFPNRPGLDWLERNYGKAITAAAQPLGLQVAYWRAPARAA